MREATVVTCLLVRRGAGGDEVLLLRRSEKVSTYRGRWAGVSGYLEPGAEPLEQAYREIEEELGLPPDGVRLLVQGEPLTVVDEGLGIRWTVHPFLFEALRPEDVRIDWEHVESRWLKPEEVAALDTVPALAGALADLLGGI